MFFVAALHSRTWRWWWKEAPDCAGSWCEELPLFDMCMISVVFSSTKEIKHERFNFYQHASKFKGFVLREMEPLPNFHTKDGRKQEEEPGFTLLSAVATENQNYYISKYN